MASPLRPGPQWDHAHQRRDLYRRAWTFTDPTGDYNDATGTVTDSIAKANAVINVTPYSVTYDGTLTPPPASASGVPGESRAAWISRHHAHQCRHLQRHWTFTDITGNYNKPAARYDTIAKAKFAVPGQTFTKVYGAAQPTIPNGVFLTGIGTDSITVSYSTPVTMTSDVASYPVVSDLVSGNPNYEITIAASVENVTKATLIVGANSMTMVQGSNVPTLSAYYVDFVLGQDASVLGGKLTSSTDVDTNKPGDYTITPGGLTSVNYNIEFVDGTLKVLPKGSNSPPIPKLGGGFGSFSSLSATTAPAARSARSPTSCRSPSGTPPRISSRRSTWSDQHCPALQRPRLTTGVVS